MKSRSKCNTMPRRLSYEGKIFNTGESIENSFPDYIFTSFLQKDNTDVDNLLSNLHSTDEPTSSHTSSVEIDVSEVCKLLSKLDVSKGAGPDHLPGYFLIKVARSISIPIAGGDDVLTYLNFVSSRKILKR